MCSTGGWAGSSVRAGARVLGVLLALAGAAAADDKAGRVVDEENGFELTVPAGWQRATLVDADSVDELEGMFTCDATGQVLIIANIPGSTDGAYQGKDEFFAGVERGIAKGFTGYARLSSRHFLLGKLPVYDLWFRATRDGKDVALGARYLFFKGRALSLVIDLPGARKPDKATRAILESFKPLK